MALSALQVVLCFVPLVWVALSVNLSEAVRLAASVGVWPISFALLCMLVSTALGALRWSILLRAYQGTAPPSYLELLRHNLISLYFGLLPGGVGSEAVRAWRTRDAAAGLVRSAMIVFVDRLAGLIGLLLLAAIGGILGGPLKTVVVAKLTTAAAVAAVVLSLVALGVPWIPLALPNVARWLESAPGFLRPLAGIRPPKQPARLLPAVALSTGTQGAIVAAYLPILLAVAPATDIAAALRVAPFVILLTFIPLTPLGLGQRELVFIGLWGAAGVSSAAAVAASMLVFVAGISMAMIGGLVLVFERWQARSQLKQ